MFLTVSDVDRYLWQTRPSHVFLISEKHEDCYYNSRIHHSMNETVCDRRDHPQSFYTPIFSIPCARMISTFHAMIVSIPCAAVPIVCADFVILCADFPTKSFHRFACIFTSLTNARSSPNATYAVTSRKSTFSDISPQFLTRFNKQVT